MRDSYRRLDLVPSLPAATVTAQPVDTQVVVLHGDDRRWYTAKHGDRRRGRVLATAAVRRNTLDSVRSGEVRQCVQRVVTVDIEDDGTSAVVSNAVDGPPASRRVRGERRREVACEVLGVVTALAWAYLDEGACSSALTVAAHLNLLDRLYLHLQRDVMLVGTTGLEPAASAPPALRSSY